MQFTSTLFSKILLLKGSLIIFMLQSAGANVDKWISATPQKTFWDFFSTTKLSWIYSIRYFFIKKTMLFSILYYKERAFVSILTIRGG